jgi:hypothetical protein
VGYSNPPIPWSELEQKLSGGALLSQRLFNEAKFSKDGGDSPAWSQHRAPYAPPPYEKAQRPAGPVTACVLYSCLRCSGRVFSQSSEGPFERQDGIGRLPNRLGLLCAPGTAVDVYVVSVGRQKVSRHGVGGCGGAPTEGKRELVGVQPQTVPTGWPSSSAAPSPTSGWSATRSPQSISTALTFSGWWPAVCTGWPRVPAGQTSRVLGWR